MKKILLSLGILIGLVSCSTPQQDSYPRIKYNIYFGDRLAGSQEAWQDEAGNFRYVYEFNDRGRGPHYEEKVLLDEDGVKTYHEIIGHNYLKDTVHEVFEIKDRQGIWKSNSESGQKKLDKNYFYTSVDGSIGATEILVRSLMAEDDQRLDLLPGGTTEILSIESHTPKNGEELKLVELAGFSFAPLYIWLDKNDRFFASTSSWFTCIPEGKEELKETLIEIQEAKEEKYLQNLAKTLTKTPEKGIFIKNVDVFDAHTGNLQLNKSVYVLDNKIDKITEAAAEIPEGAEIIDGTGKTLFPGLFDNHTHIGNTDGILHLAAGVTSVRDMANSLDLPELKSKFDSGVFMGPRILIMSGFVDQAGPYAGPTGKIVKTLEEGLEGIAFYHERGYQQIKLYSSIDPDWVQELTKKAHGLGMRVSGHIPAFMTADQAVRAGYDEIQHINMLALNFLSDTIDTRTPLRFSMVAEHTHALDVDGKEFEDFLALLKERNIVIDPTVSIFEGMLTSKAGDPDPSFVKILDRLPVQVKRGFFSGGLPIPEGKEEQYKSSYQTLLKMVKRLHESGIVIVPGTDAMAGFGLHRELENYVRAGISEADVLKSATLTSAQVTGNADILGSVEVGKLADLILVDGNPLENISDIRRVSLTIKDGKIYDPPSLYKAIGVRP